MANDTFDNILEAHLANLRNERAAWPAMLIENAVGWLRGKHEEPTRDAILAQIDEGDGSLDVREAAKAEVDIIFHAIGAVEAQEQAIKEREFALGESDMLYDFLEREITAFEESGQGGYAYFLREALSTNPLSSSPIKTRDLIERHIVDEMRGHNGTDDVIDALDRAFDAYVASKMAAADPVLETEANPVDEAAPAKGPLDQPLGERLEAFYDCVDRGVKALKEQDVSMIGDLFGQAPERLEAALKVAQFELEDRNPTAQEVREKIAAIIQAADGAQAEKEFAMRGLDYAVKLFLAPPTQEVPAEPAQPAEDLPSAPDALAEPLTPREAFYRRRFEGGEFFAFRNAIEARLALAGGPAAAMSYMQQGKFRTTYGSSIAAAHPELLAYIERSIARDKQAEAVAAVNTAVEDYITEKTGVAADVAAPEQTAEEKDEPLSPLLYDKFFECVSHAIQTGSYGSVNIPCPQGIENSRLTGLMQQLRTLTQESRQVGIDEIRTAIGMHRSDAYMDQLVPFFRDCLSAVRAQNPGWAQEVAKKPDAAAQFDPVPLPQEALEYQRYLSGWKERVEMGGGRKVASSLLASVFQNTIELPTIHRPAQHTAFVESVKVAIRRISFVDDTRKTEALKLFDQMLATECRPYRRIDGAERESLIQELQTHILVPFKAPGSNVPGSTIHAITQFIDGLRDVPPGQLTYAKLNEMGEDRLSFSVIGVDSGLAKRKLNEVIAKHQEMVMPTPAQQY